MVTLFQTFNKIIIIIALALFSFNGFAQSKQVKRTTSSQLMIYNGLVDFTPPEISKPIKSANRPLGCMLGVESSYYYFASGRSVNDYANTFPGVVSINRDIPNIKGARADGTAYFIDGVRVYHFEPLSVF